MIKGIGVDLVDIQRIKNVMERTPRFIGRIMTHREEALLHRKGMRPSSVAGIFAGKEAVSKMLGSGIGTVSWQEIEILNHHTGSPYVTLHGKAQQLAAEKGINQVMISISHDGNMAIAHVIGQA